MNEWISVKTELPTGNEFIIFYSEATGVTCGGYKKRYNTNEYAFIEYIGMRVIKVTHWMRLPNVPPE